MATLSSQINGMSTSQKTTLAAKIKPLAGTLSTLVGPAVAPLLMGFIRAAVSNPSVMGAAIAPAEGMLPSRARSVIQGAITQVIGGKGGSTTTTAKKGGGRTRTKTTVVRPGPRAPVEESMPGEPVKEGMPGWMKLVAVLGGVSGGLWAIKRFKKKSA